MPVDLSDAETGGIDLYFADDLSGINFQLRESAVYEAEEVREDVDGDIPKFGKWLPVETEDSDGWAVALGELIEELQTYENPLGLTFEVTRCEKSGPKDTDPYEVNVEVVDGNSKQTSL